MVYSINNFNDFVNEVFSGSFARLLRYLPAGQSSMYYSTPPVDRRAKPCTRAKFRAKKSRNHSERVTAGRDGVLIELKKAVRENKTPHKKSQKLYTKLYKIL